MGDFSNPACVPGVMKADLRISIKDFRRNKLLRIHLSRTPFGTRQFFVRMNGQRWPASGKPVSLTRVLVSVRKSLVRADGQAEGKAKG